MEQNRVEKVSKKTHGGAESKVCRALPAGLANLR